ncbi:hypothetical protein D3C73_1576440 [compost metagenome]
MYRMQIFADLDRISHSPDRIPYGFVPVIARFLPFHHQLLQMALEFPANLRMNFSRLNLPAYGAEITPNQFVIPNHG